MFLGMPLPKWKQILLKKNQSNKKTYYEALNPNILFMAESCMSINLVVEAIHILKGGEKVKILLPDYFCNQTIYSFNESWMEILYYPIKSDIDLDWDYLKKWTKENEFDVFLFTHYFGKYNENISRAKEICKNKNAILIEDCAHVLYPTGKMGLYGDFVIYSPHKQLPIMDGAVLMCNEDENNPIIMELFNWIKEKYKGISENKGNAIWYIKKAFQKVIPIHRKLTYYPGIHYSDEFGEKHSLRRISRDSYNTICDLRYIDFKKIAYIRRDNLDMMNYIVSLKYPDVIPMITSEVDVPYFAVYSLEKVENKGKVVEDMINKGFTVLYWPDLPYHLNGTDGHDDMEKLSENIIIMPVHQDLSPQRLAKKFLGELKTEKCSINIKKIDKETYISRYASLQINNIPQDWVYGDAKEATERWKAIRYGVYIDGRLKGVVQILEKKVLGITVAVRINRGPVMEESFSCSFIKFLIIQEIRKKYMHGIPLIYAPYIYMSPYNIHLATFYNWKNISLFGYPSAIINLEQSEDDLYKGMKAFWRKNLKHAKKCLTIKYNEYNTDEIIELYIGFLKMKKIPGIPEHILRYLFSLDMPPLEIISAHNEDGEMIAYKVLYKHGNCGTSFIAWNTEEGRNKQARTLLIWSSMLRLKELGYKFFDLGGVDDINTEDVAKYKRGAGGIEYRLLGEFVKL